MKKWIIALTVLFTTTVSANAMSYEQARDQALFLTDKMAYELNLTQDQYEAAFEINLDYLLSIDNYNDLYGTYWTRRNLDLSYILLDWQYNAFCAANYFYRPLYWDAGYWHFSIYARYPHRTYFFFGRPDFYWTYRGGHSWHMNGGHSWYHGRVFGRDHRIAQNSRGMGMRNGFDRGDYRNSSGHFSRQKGGRGLERVNAPSDNRRMDSNRGSSMNRGGGSVNRSNGSMNRGMGSSRPSGSQGGVGTRSGSNTSVNNRGFGGSRQSSTRSTVGSRSYSGSSQLRSSASTGRSYSTPNRTFSPSHSSSATTRSSAPSRSSSSRSSSSSHSSSSRSSGGFSSHSGGSSHSSGGHSGGGHFGGHR